MEEILEKINVKTIGAISIVISVAIVTFYTLQSVKTYLEIKKLQNEEE
jgi:hypothetical protein